MLSLVISFIIGFLVAWFIVSTVLYIYDSHIMCPDKLFLLLSLPLQILSISYFLIKRRNNK